METQAPTFHGHLLAMLTASPDVQDDDAVTDVVSGIVDELHAADGFDVAISALNLLHALLSALREAGYSESETVQRLAVFAIHQTETEG